MSQSLGYCSICGNQFQSDNNGSLKHIDFQEMDDAHVPEKMHEETEFETPLSKIIYLAGRTFFVLNFSDENEDSASCGQDFFDVCPEGVPVPFINMAKDAARIFEEDNGIDLYQALILAAGAEDIDLDEISDEYTGEFSHCVAMTYAGTGIHWTDNHEEFMIGENKPVFNNNFSTFI